MKVTSVKSFLSFVPGDLASCSETARNSCDGGHFHFCLICLTNPVKEKSGRLITERPEFYIALATMIMGSQFFLAGFLGEIILRNKKIKKQYIITETINE